MYTTSDLVGRMTKRSGGMCSYSYRADATDKRVRNALDQA